MPGAGNNIGLRAGAKAAPDGHTLVMGETSNLAVNPYLYKNLDFSAVDDLVPVALMGSGPIPASRKALEKAGWKVGDLDLVEANEAFAAQACAVTATSDAPPATTASALSMPKSRVIRPRWLTVE